MRPGLVAVAVREVAWMRRDPAFLFLLIGVPLIAFALLGATFSTGVIRDLRIDVVDADRSPASARFVQAIDAAPGVLVDRRSSDLDAAMRAIRAGETIAAVYLPANLERDILAGRRPQVVILYNRQFFTPGNVAASAVQGAVAAAAAELPRPRGGVSGSLVVERYVLSNPALNYAQFLLRAILPTVLHVVVAVGAAVAVGSEFHARRGVADWLAAAGGRPLTALFGKLAPLFAIFVCQMAVASALLHGALRTPFRGDPVLLAAAAMLFVAAYLAIGALLVLVARSLAAGLALVGIVCSPAFGFAGVGFPILAMGGFAKGWGALLPLRWYIQILVDQAARGAPGRLSLPPLLALAGLAALFLLLAWARLRAIAGAPPARPAAPPPQQGRGVAAAFAGEYGRALRDSGAFGLIVMAPLLYAALYPQPYRGQLIRDVPIAVIDEDGAELSRRIVQALDAHEAIAVAERLADVAAAEAAIGARRVFGVVTIPPGAERDFLHGRSAHVAAHVDAAYFLAFNRVSQGIAEAVAAVAADTATGPARPDGSLAAAALAQASPIELLAEPLYNPTGAYGAYVVPAALILILQQSLMMGVATLGGVAGEGGGAAAVRARGLPAAVAGQALAHLALALPAWTLYLVVLPRVYGYAATAHVLGLAVVAVPFILAVSLLGQTVGALFRRRETAVALLLGLGLPLFFLAGVAWPPEAIPPVLRALGRAIPSTAGIEALLRINQTGAGLAEARGYWLQLWALVLVYGVLAVLVPRLRSREAAHA